MTVWKQYAGRICLVVFVIIVVAIVLAIVIARRRTTAASTSSIEPSVPPLARPSPTADRHALLGIKNKLKSSMRAPREELPAYMEPILYPEQTITNRVHFAPSLDETVEDGVEEIADQLYTVETGTILMGDDENWGEEIAEVEYQEGEDGANHENIDYRNIGHGDTDYPVADDDCYQGDEVDMARNDVENDDDAQIGELQWSAAAVNPEHEEADVQTGEMGWATGGEVPAPALALEREPLYNEIDGQQPSLLPHGWIEEVDVPIDYTLDDLAYAARYQSGLSNREAIVVEAGLEPGEYVRCGDHFVQVRPVHKDIMSANTMLAAQAALASPVFESLPEDYKQFMKHLATTPMIPSAPAVPLTTAGSDVSFAAPTPTIIPLRPKGRYNLITPGSTVESEPRMIKPGRKVSIGEAACRRALENMFGLPFPCDRPDWLRNPETGHNLELDCYNSTLELAVEYNGRQHYEEVGAFHKSKFDYLEQLRRDVFKLWVCERRGIWLIIVPYTVSPTDIPDFIYSHLGEKHIRQMRR